MTKALHITPGMTLSLPDDELKGKSQTFRVESNPISVTVGKNSMLKVSLINVATNVLVEKIFKPDQIVQEVSQIEKILEFLYPEKDKYNFLDIGNLEQELVPASVLGDKVHFLKEGTQITAKFYGDEIFSCELPQFLELMVVKTEGGDLTNSVTSHKIAHLETGAKIKVLPFIESGDMVKIDTHIADLSDSFVQRL
jgi:elongation factor P